MLILQMKINGTPRPNPTPAAHMTDPLKNTSNNSFKNLLFILRIPENVNDEFGFIVRDKPNATTGKQYILHAVGPQWKTGYVLE